MYHKKMSKLQRAKLEVKFFLMELTRDYGCTYFIEYKNKTKSLMNISHNIWTLESAVGSIVYNCQ